MTLLECHESPVVSALENTWCEVRGLRVITCGPLVHGIAPSSLYVCFCRVSPSRSKREMKDSVNIKFGVKGSIKYWKEMADQDSSGQYMESFAPIILYWENVFAAMDHPLPPTPSKISEPFWLATRFCQP